MRDTVHIPDDLQKRVTALVPAVNAQVLMGTANSTAVIRHALALGLTLLEQAVTAGRPIPQVRDLAPPPVVSSRVVDVPEAGLPLHVVSIMGDSSACEMFQTPPAPLSTSWPAFSDDDVTADVAADGVVDTAADDGWAPA